MLQTTPRRETDATLVDAAQEYKRRRKLLLAMVVLLAALVIVLVRDRQLWFGSDETPAPEDTWTGPTPSSPATAVQQPPAPAIKAKKHVAGRAAEKELAKPAVVATGRPALPPLEVEVIARDTHHTVRSSGSATSAPATSKSAPVTNAAQRERLSSEKSEEPEVVAASYPLLGAQTKVQGSVLMQALIGADGVIEELHVISGPAILAAAARQAVLKWRFKPYLQNGRPVETQARVTVNFTIRVLNDVATKNHASTISSSGL